MFCAELCCRRALNTTTTGSRSG